MKISKDKTRIVKKLFKDIPCGTVFEVSNDDATYMKCLITSDDFRAVNLSSGVTYQFEEFNVVTLLDAGLVIKGTLSATVENLTSEVK